MNDPIPDRMPALVLVEPKVLDFQEVDVPRPGPGEVLVEVRAATTCGTDVKAFLRGHPQIPIPGTLGHEYSGVVASVGDSAPFAVGDAVMGVHSAPCQACAWCLRDQENLCESIMSTKVLGSYAKYLLVPARIARLNVFPKPAHLPFEIASLLEPLSCVAQALEKVRVEANSKVLVIGPGAIGLMFVAALRAKGVGEVALVGRNASRLAVGRSMGATTFSLDEVPVGAFDVVIECTGTVEIWERSVDFARRGGTVVLFGGCPSGTRASFDTRRVHYDEITLVSPFHFGTRAVRTAREWLLEGLDLAPLVSGIRTLEQGLATFEDLIAGRGLKYVFTP